MHWKGGVLGGLVGVLGYVIAHADPISALVPQQYANTIGTIISLIGVAGTMFAHPVGAPKQIADVIPPASPAK